MLCWRMTHLLRSYISTLHHLSYNSNLVFSNTWEKLFFSNIHLRSFILLNERYNVTNNKNPIKKNKFSGEIELLHRILDIDLLSMHMKHKERHVHMALERLKFVLNDKKDSSKLHIFHLNE